MASNSGTFTTQGDIDTQSLVNIIPAATITSITILSRSDSASITHAVKNVQIYTYSNA